MVSIAPFASVEEHASYTALCGTEPEEGSVGFKIFDVSADGKEEKLGFLSFKFVSNSAYLLQMHTFAGDDPDLLQGALKTIISFFSQIHLESLIFPILTERDHAIASSLPFEKVSETMYVLEFKGKNDQDDHCHEEGCHCHDESCHHE